MKKRNVILGIVFTAIFFIACKDSNIINNYNSQYFYVDFNVDGNLIPQYQRILKGEKVIEPIGISKTGYILKGWYKEATFNNLWDFNNEVVTGDITLYAKWEINPDNCCIKFVSAGENHTVVIKKDGTLWAWGSFDLLGLGDSVLGVNVDTSMPIQVGISNDWKNVSAGSSHTMAIKNDGTLWAWGSNGAGQLGIGDFQYRSIPCQVGTDKDWEFVSAAYLNTMAIKDDGTLWAWGFNDKEQLGLGLSSSTQYKNTPNQISSNISWLTVSVSEDRFIMAIKKDGTLWSWGYDNGLLGLSGFSGDKNIPTKVGIDSNWVSVSAGRNLVTAIKKDGTLWTWGSTGLSISFINYPTQVGNDDNWETVASTNSITIAKRKDGSLWTWGDNSFGKLGLGHSESINTPTQIGIDTDWKTISTGGALVTAIKEDGSLWTWGHYYSNNKGTVIPTPRLVIFTE